MGVLEDIKVLEENRDKIRDCDIQILRLLEKRIAAAAEIGKVKRKNNKPIYAPEIERKNIDELAAKSEYPGLVEAVWPVIMCYTRTVE